MSSASQPQSTQPLNSSSALGVATIALYASGWSLATLTYENVNYGLASRDDEQVLFLAKSRLHRVDTLSVPITEREVSRTEELAQAIGARPGLMQLSVMVRGNPMITSTDEEPSVFAAMTFDTLREAAAEPETKWAKEKRSGEGGFQLSYSKRTRQGLLLDPRVMAFEITVPLDSANTEPLTEN